MASRDTKLSPCRYTGLKVAGMYQPREALSSDSGGSVVSALANSVQGRDLTAVIAALSPFPKDTVIGRISYEFEDRTILQLLSELLEKFSSARLTVQCAQAFLVSNVVSLLIPKRQFLPEKVGEF